MFLYKLWRAVTVPKITVCRWFHKVGTLVAVARLVIRTAEE